MSTVSAAALRDLHRIHDQLADLRGRLKRGPKQIVAHRGSVAKLEQAVTAAHDIVQQTKMAVDRMQLDLKSSEEKIANWQNQLNSAGSNKAYQALQEQIAAGEMAGSVLEDEILEMLGRIDDLEARAIESEKNLELGKAELAKVEVNVAATSEKLKEEIVRLEADLAVAEKGISGDFKNDYLRVIRSKGADGLAPGDDGVCQGCGQSITLNMQNDLALSKPTFCQSCGCLLYLSE